MIHLAAISNDPIGHLNPGATVLGQRRRCHSHGRDGQGGGRATVPLLVVLLVVRRCRRPSGRPRRRSSTRSRPTGRARCSPSGASARSPTTRSARRTCATPPPTAPRPGFAPTSSSTTSLGTAFTRGKVRLQSDGTPWRPLVHIEDIASRVRRRSGRAARGGPRPGLQRRPRRGRRADPRHRQRGIADDGRTGDVRQRAPVPTPATTGSTSPRSARSCPPSRPQWSIRRASRSWRVT